MPLTQQTASEVSRLYLNSKLKMLTAFEEEKQLQRILESLQREELYNLSPEDKTKVHMYYIMQTPPITPLLGQHRTSPH